MAAAAPKNFHFASPCSSDGNAFEKMVAGSGAFAFLWPFRQRLQRRFRFNLISMKQPSFEMALLTLFVTVYCGLLVIRCYAGRKLALFEL